MHRTKSFDYFSLSLRLDGLIKEHSSISPLFGMDPFVMRGERKEHVPVGSESPVTYISYDIEYEEDIIPPATVMREWIKDNSNALTSLHSSHPHVEIQLVLNIYSDSFVEWSFSQELLELLQSHHISFSVEIWREDPENEYREFSYPEAPPGEHPLSDNSPDYQFDRVEITVLSEDELSQNLMRLSNLELCGFTVSSCRSSLSVYPKHINTIFDTNNRHSYLEFIERLKDTLIIPSATIPILKSDWILYRNSRGMEITCELFRRLKDLGMELKIHVHWAEGCPIHSR